MCSPELTRGLCQICTGTLTLENTHVDRFGYTWDVHKGVCAIYAGDVPYRHCAVLYQYVERIHRAVTETMRRIVIQEFHQWIREIASEDHYCNDGPSQEKL